MSRDAHVEIRSSDLGERTMGTTQLSKACESDRAELVPIRTELASNVLSLLRVGSRQASRPVKSSSSHGCYVDNDPVNEVWVFLLVA